MKNSLTIKRVAAVSGLFLGAFCLSVVAQSTWTPPPPSPPTCPPTTLGCNAPINVGSFPQTRVSLLTLGNLIVTNLTVASGTPAVGSVLTAADTSGTVKWGAAGGGSGGGGGMYMRNVTLSNDYTVATQSSCRWPNPMTGSCSCPAGYNASTVYDFYSYGSAGYYSVPAPDGPQVSSSGNVQVMQCTTGSLAQNTPRTITLNMSRIGFSTSNTIGFSPARYTNGSLKDCRMSISQTTQTCTFYTNAFDNSVVISADHNATWSGCTSSTATTCTITLDANKTIGAQFAN